MGLQTGTPFSVRILFCIRQLPWACSSFGHWVHPAFSLSSEAANLLTLPGCKISLWLCSERASHQEPLHRRNIWWNSSLPRQETRKSSNISWLEWRLDVTNPWRAGYWARWSQFHRLLQDIWKRAALLSPIFLSGSSSWPFVSIRNWSSRWYCTCCKLHQRSDEPAPSYICVLLQVSGPAVFWQDQTPGLSWEGRHWSSAVHQGN